MQRIFLIGYMGAGKSTIGRSLAKSLNLTFYDLDYFIESRYKKSISQIFEEEGEIGFRKIENSILKEVGELEDIVVATGGGTPCFYDNMAYMKEQGQTVYLNASPEALTNRLALAKSKRPLIADKNDKELLRFVSATLCKRNIHYSLAEIVFNTDEIINGDDVESCVDRLAKILG